MNTRALQNVRGVVQITADINESDVVNLVMSAPLSTATLRMSYSIYLETEYKSA